jgi:hypothetical protein
MSDQRSPAAPSIDSAKQYPVDSTPAAPPAIDPRHALATEIYATWRNAHLNNVPVEFFNRLEAASEHLIEAIKAHL